MYAEIRSSAICVNTTWPPEASSSAIFVYMWRHEVIDPADMFLYITWPCDIRGSQTAMLSIHDWAYCHFTLPVIFDVIVGIFETEFWHSSIRHLRSLSIGSCVGSALRSDHFFLRELSLPVILVGSRTCVDTLKYRKNFCSCRELNHDFPVVKPISHSLYRLRYRGLPL